MDLEGLTPGTRLEQSFQGPKPVLPVHLSSCLLPTYDLHRKAQREQVIYLSGPDSLILQRVTQEEMGLI